MKILRLPVGQFYDLYNKTTSYGREELPLSCPNFLMRIYDTLVLREDRAEISALPELNGSHITLNVILRNSITGDEKNG